MTPDLFSQSATPDRTPADGGHHSVKRGRGVRPAVFLPGTGWYAESGLDIADALATTHTTHLLDLPGIGRAAGRDGVHHLDDLVPWLDSYLDSAGLDRVDIIGHSLGGLLGLAFATGRPARVRSLTLLDVGYAKMPRIPTAMLGPAAVLAPVLDVAHRLLGDRVLGTNEPTNATSDPEHDHPRGGPRGLALLLAAYRSDPPRMLEALAVPCLLLYGDRTGERRRRQARVRRQIRALKDRPQVQIGHLAGGHYAHREDPRALAAIASFLG